MCFKNEFAMINSEYIKQEGNLYIVDPKLLGAKLVIRAMCGGLISGLPWRIEGPFPFERSLLEISFYGVCDRNEKFFLKWEDLMRSYLEEKGTFIVSTSGMISVNEPDLEETTMLPYGAKPSGLVVLDYKCPTFVAELFDPYIDVAEMRQQLNVELYKLKYPDRIEKDEYDSQFEKWAME